MDICYIEAKLYTHQKKKIALTQDRVPDSLSEELSYIISIGREVSTDMKQDMKK